MSLDNLYTSEEVASILDVSLQRVRHYALTRKLEKWGSRYVFRRNDIEIMRRNFDFADQIDWRKKNER